MSRLDGNEHNDQIRALVDGASQERGVSKFTLMRALGLPYSTVNAAYYAQRLGTPELVVRVQDALSILAGVPVLPKPELVDRAQVDRQKEKIKHLQVLAGNLRVARQAIEAMCKACSGDICRISDCPLRPVSPLPLATRTERMYEGLAEVGND